MTDGSAPQLRLPGSVAEVDASPEGPGIGAFFDLDGTLVAGFTAAAHTRDRLLRREVGPGDFLRMTQLAVEYKLGRREIQTLIEGGAGTARGRAAAITSACCNCWGTTRPSACVRRSRAAWARRG